MKLVLLWILASLSDIDWAKEQMRKLPRVQEFANEFHQTETVDAEALRQTVIDALPEVEPIEGTEAEFHPELLNDPERNIGILSSTTVEIPAEEILVTCREGGRDHILLRQRRIVNVRPPVVKTVKHCLGGHEDKKSKEEWLWQDKADERKKELEKKYSRDPTIKNFKVEKKCVKEWIKGGLVDRCRVKCKFTHKDDVARCDKHRIETIVVKPAEIAGPDTWQAETPAALGEMEKNARCHLVEIVNQGGTATRRLEGLDVTRDSWARDLHFTCQNDEGKSQCEQLREQGGILVEKKCIAHNALDDCETWEKTYDIGKRGSSVLQTHTFADRKIFGLNGEFTPKMEKDTSFQEVANAMKFAVAMGQGAKVGDSGKPDFFEGKSLHCRCQYQDGSLFDCCKKGENCSVEENQLAQLRSDGKCHFVGSRTGERVFCCFSTPMARIVQEKLKLDWGSAESPECGPLAVEQIAALNISDLSEADEPVDVKIETEKVQAEVRSLVQKGWRP